MKMLALLGTPIAIFAITEFYALKMNDWQFDPFETGLAFVVALIIRNFVRVAVCVHNPDRSPLRIHS
jgi:hypothetical protein